MTSSSMCRLSEWCRDHQTTAPLYDREAVGAEGDAFFMFCLAKGVKETGRGGSREEAQEQAATKVLAKVEERERCRRVSSLASVLNTKRLSLEEPVSFLAKLALDQSFQVSYNEFIDEGLGQYGCLAKLSAGPQVGVCYGAGEDQIIARTHAARSALNYLRVISNQVPTVCPA